MSEPTFKLQKQMAIESLEQKLAQAKPEPGAIGGWNPYRAKKIRDIEEELKKVKATRFSAKKSKKHVTTT